MPKYYTAEALSAYALYHVVCLVDCDNQERIGWLVPRENGWYSLLPLSSVDSIYNYKRSHIKKIYHRPSNYLIPKEVE